MTSPIQEPMDTNSFECDAFSRIAFKRIALGIEYDGTNFCGWQIQKDLSTVQGKLEYVLTKIADHPIATICAGRTDVGVHALEQVVHFDTSAERPLSAWVLGGNGLLPPTIKILWAREVVSTFNARFSAKVRSYRYLIYHRATPSAFAHHRALWYPHALDASLMQKAAGHLLGEHDFSSFRASGCQSKSTKRNVIQLNVIQRKSDIPNLENITIIDIKANAFLYHMVRNIVGALLLIGSGKKKPLWLKELLEARDRTQGAVTAPAHGLYFVGAEY